MVFQPTPSSKALGKRPVRGMAAAPSPKSSFTPSGGSPALEDDAEDCSAPASTTGSVQTRTNQKRVLPTRARRGGPGAGVGTGDIDLNILDLLKRRGENDPLIPSKTVFVLTTDSRFVPSASTSELGLNHYANERYFDRVEVIKAYQEQQDIQIPEFTQLTDEEMVGGRLRARSNEVECADLSDAAYEKRHRKHEMLEKRQRLREKEKLQHEHYKLKERIDQLRIIDYNAFLSLPAETFGEVDTPIDYESMIAVGASASSAAAMHEGERRRRLMLEVATSLEDRYRTLLPPDRKIPEKDKYHDRMASVSVEPSTVDENIDDDAAEPELELTESVAPNRLKSLKVKLKLRPPTAPTSPAPLSAPLRTSRRRRGQSVDPEVSLLLPDGVPENDSITVTASHRVATPRTRSKTSTRLPSPPNHIYLQDRDAAIIDTFPSSNHISPNRPTPNYVASTYRDIEHSVSGQVGPNLPMETYPEHVYAALNYSNLNYGFPHQTAPHIELQVHHLSPEDFETPQRKKPRTAHISVDRIAPPMEYTAMMDDIDDMPAFSPVLPAYMMSGASPMPLELPAPIQHGFRASYSQYERPLQPESPVPPVPVESAPAEYKRTGSPMEEEYIPSTGQQFTAPLQRRMTPTPSRRRESTAPVLSTASASPSVGSLQAYSLPSGPGRRRPPPCILAVSKYNVAPGRKTGRSVKAFGADVPPFDEKEFDFELPYGLIEEVEVLRSGPVDYDNTVDEENDHAYWLVNGDQHMNGTLQESVSALGLEGMVDTDRH